MIYHFAFILSTYASQEFTLGLGDSQPLESILDLDRHRVPVALRLLAGAHEVVDFIVVQLGQFVVGPHAHQRCRLFVEDLQRLEPPFEHPLWLIFHPREFAHHLLAQAHRSLEEVVLLLPEAVLGVVKLKIRRL